MGKILERIGQKFSQAIGMDLMGERYKMLTYLYIFLMIHTTIESVFVNTLLYRISNGNMAYVILYRGISYVSSAVAMNIGAYISKRTNPIFVLRLGCVFYCISYSILFIGFDHMETLRHIIPIFSGLGGAFYWSGHNSLVLGYSNRSNRDLGIGILGIVQGVTTLFVPVITGFVISMMPGSWGYRLMFGLAMVFAIAQIFFATRLPAIEVGSVRQSEFRKAFALIKKETTFKLMLGYEFIRGMRDGVFSFLLNMLLFEIVTDERLTGINTFLTGVMAIVGSWAYGKFVLPRLRARFTAGSTTILLLCSLLLFAWMSPTSVMLFTTVNAFFQLFILNAYNNTTYDITGQTPEASQCSRELYGIREVAIALGRVGGLYYVYRMPSGTTASIWVIIVLTSLQYIGAFFIGRVKKLVDLQGEEEVAV